MKPRFIFIGLYLVLAGAVIAQVLEPEDPFRVEVDRRPSSIPYDPDRMIRMTLYDYPQAPRTTGRYTTFELPMNSLIQRWIIHNGTPGSFRTFNEWGGGPDNTNQILPGLDQSATWVDSRVRENYVSTTVTSLTGNELVLFQKVLFPAKLRPEPFPGYQATSARPASLSKMYYLGFDYCGFDVFEYTKHRAWQRAEPPDLTIGPPEHVPHPFDIARVFGYLDDNGVLYKYAVECDFGPSPNGYCRTGAAFNEWINTIYYFEAPLLCDIPDLIDAHHDWLRAHVVEEQTEILNPRYEYLSTGSSTNSARAVQ